MGLSFVSVIFETGSPSTLQIGEDGLELRSPCCDYSVCYHQLFGLLCRRPQGILGAQLTNYQHIRCNGYKEGFEFSSFQQSIMPHPHAISERGHMRLSEARARWTHSLDLSPEMVGVQLRCSLSPGHLSLFGWGIPGSDSGQIEVTLFFP